MLEGPPSVCLGREKVAENKEGSCGGRQLPEQAVSATVPTSECVGALARRRRGLSNAKRDKEVYLGTR